MLKQYLLYLHWLHCLLETVVKTIVQINSAISKEVQLKGVSKKKKKKIVTKQTKTHNKWNKNKINNHHLFFLKNHHFL